MDMGMFLYAHLTRQNKQRKSAIILQCCCLH